jgi:hypothetical protein
MFSGNMHGRTIELPFLAERVYLVAIEGKNMGVLQKVVIE